MNENLNIMVVDDEKPILNLFAQYLESEEGFRVFTESNGLNALEIIKRRRIDCCFLDISMPVIDGVKLAEQIHLHDKTIPIVIMTGNPTADNAIKTIRSGVVDFLTKPINIHQIPLTIRRVIKERSMFVDSIMLKEATEKNRELLKINHELQQKLKDLEIISLILQKLEQAATIKNLINTLVNLAGEITRCDEACFCAFEQDGKEPSVLGSFARTKEKQVLSPANITLQNIKKVADDGIPLISNNSLNSCIMAVPLKIKASVFGVLVLYSDDKTDRFNGKDLYFMNFLLEKASSQVENLVLYENIFESFFAQLYALVETIEARDPYTRQHSHRASRYAVSIAESMNCIREDVDKLKVSGLLHDIGKIGTPDKILMKPGKLSEEEYDVIKKHPVTGSNIIGRLGMWLDEQTIIRHHHERFDGKGYPDGLKGEEIPLLSRILAVADVYDALTSDRSYRKKMEDKEALKIIRENSGSQFDPKVVEAFLKSYGEHKIVRLSGDNE